jgi:hypothetical protein
MWVADLDFGTVVMYPLARKRRLQRAIAGAVTVLGFCAATPSTKPAEAAFVSVGVGIPGYYAPAPACTYYYLWMRRVCNPLLCSCWGRRSRAVIPVPDGGSSCRTESGPITLVAFGRLLTHSGPSSTVIIARKY